MQPFFNVAQHRFNVVSTLIWHYLNVVSTWPQRQLKVYRNQWKVWICRNIENGHIQNVVLTLINVMELDIQNNNIVSGLSNVVYIKVNLALFNVLNFNVYIHNIVLTLIRYCPTSWSHVTLTTTLRQRWNVFWGLKNVAKSLHNFVKFIKLKTYTFSRISLNYCFRKLSKRYW